MNCLICSDKFKGSLSARAACGAIRQGLQLNYPIGQFQCLPLADGGDGSLAVIENYVDGAYINISTVDPLGRPIDARYLLSGTTAYIELAIASGLSKLSINEKSPLYTDTCGTGILIKDALDKGARHIVLMLGGSCSTDAGLGIVHALGYRLIDKNGVDVPPQGGYLTHIDRIIAPDHLASFSMQLLCDVNNTLYGPAGAAYVFAPQKGANEQEVGRLDQGLKNISNVIQSQSGIDISNVIGGGSAGGVAAGLYGLLGATINSGFDIMSDMAALPKAIQAADIVITGEGQLDQTSLNGKVIGKVAQLCYNLNTPLIAIVGKNELSDEEVFLSQLREVHAIYPDIVDISDAIANAGHHLTAITSKLAL